MSEAQTQRSLPETVATVGALADEAEVRDTLQWFANEKRWIDRKHLELCRVAAPTFQEDERAAWMADEFRSLGYRIQIDRAGNVTARLPGTTAPPLVALSAHLDTVLAPRRPDDIIVNGNGRLEGPGVADNGAGLAGLLAVAASLSRYEALRQQSNRVLFIANVGEEGEGNLSGMRYFCRQSELGENVSAFVVLDGPSTDHITSRAVASRRFEVKVTGPGGHSWSDFGIGNPVQALSRAVTIFSEEQATAESNGYRSAFNFGTIDGGTSVNAIPASATAKVDLRSEEPARIEEMSALLTSAVERALATENSRAGGTRLTAKIREIGFRPGGALPTQAPILQCIHLVDRYLGIRSQEDCASTDANVPLSLGRQAISIGAGGRGGGAHTAAEWYDPEGREIGLKRVFLLTTLLVRALAAS